MKVNLEYREPFIHDRINKYLDSFMLGGISSGFYIKTNNLNNPNTLSIQSSLDDNNTEEKNAAYIHYYKEIAVEGDKVIKRDPVLLNIEMFDTEFINKPLPAPQHKMYFVVNVYLGVYYEDTGVVDAKIFITSPYTYSYSYPPYIKLDKDDVNNVFIKSDLSIVRNSIRGVVGIDTEGTDYKRREICRKAIVIPQVAASTGWGADTDYVIRFAFELAKSYLDANHNYIIEDEKKYQLILIDQLLVRGKKGVGGPTTISKIYDYLLSPDDFGWRTDLSKLPVDSALIMHNVSRINLEEQLLNLENQILNISILNEEAYNTKALNLYNFNIADLTNRIYGNNDYWGFNNSSSDYCSISYYLNRTKNITTTINTSYVDLKNINVPLLYEKISDKSKRWYYPSLKVDYTLVFKNQPNVLYFPYIGAFLIGKKLNILNTPNVIEILVYDYNTYNYGNNQYSNPDANGLLPFSFYSNSNSFITNLFKNNNYISLSGSFIVDMTAFLNELYIPNTTNSNPLLSNNYSLPVSLPYVLEGSLFGLNTFTIKIRFNRYYGNGNIDLSRVSLAALNVNLLDRVYVNQASYIAKGFSS